MKPIQNWLSRHQDPTSFWLHMIGVPACFVASPIFLTLHEWLLATALFIGGYALQFIGHLIQGDQSGEEMLVRKLLSRASKK